MQTRQKKDNNPVVLKLGVALVLSFAGFLCSRLRNKYIASPPSDVNEQVESRDEINDDGHSSDLAIPSCPEMDSNFEAHEIPFLHPMVDNGSSNSSPSTRHSSNRDGFLLPVFNKLIEDFDIAPPMSDTETPHHSIDTTRDVGKDEYEHEIQSLRSMVKDLREQIRCLEIQLIEYYDLKEQQVTVVELQNRLKINNVEVRALSLKIESLQAENRRLEARVGNYLRVVDELEDANARIKMLKTKLESDAELNKEQISKLEKRVVLLDKKEMDSRIDMSHRSCEPDVVKLQRLDEFENDIKDLEVGKLKIELARLLEEKGKLENEVERLQSDRCSNAEELVYLRWVNACLRYELRNYQPPPGKTVSRDLSKSLSPKSEAKAKQLILEYANIDEENDLNYEQLSPYQSFSTDLGEPDESLADAYVHHSKKPKIFEKLKSLMTRKDINGSNDMHYKPSTLVRSHSVQDLGKAYSYVVRRNSISTSSQSFERSSNTTGSFSSSSRSILALESRLAKDPKLSLSKSDFVGCGGTLKV